MQHERAQNILSGQTNLARKVFAAVPMQSFWDVQQISTEMTRQSPHNHSKAEITGCLRVLVDAGLINETASLTFRSNVKPPKAVPEQVMQPKAKAEPVKASFMDRAFELATTMRAAAEQLEQLGMEVDTALKDAGKGDEKYKQMQATLRGLMGVQDG